jgi:hypothetical protein
LVVTFVLVKEAVVHVIYVMSFFVLHVC